MQEEFDMVAGGGTSNESSTDHNCLRFHIKVLKHSECRLTATGQTAEMIYDRLTNGKMSCFEVYHKYTDEIKKLLVRKLQSNPSTDEGRTTKKKKAIINKSNVLSYLVRKPRPPTSKKKKKKNPKKKQAHGSSNTTTAAVPNDQGGEEVKEEVSREEDNQGRRRSTRFIIRDTSNT